jgi:hypothetical protein
MLRSKGELSTFGNRLVRAAQAGNWEDYQKRWTVSPNI